MNERLLLLTGSLGPGGTELSVIALARGLAARGNFAPLVVTLGSAGEYGAAPQRDRVELIELGISGGIRRPDSLRRLLSLAQIVRSREVAIVQTFLFDADFYGMLAARRGAPRAIVTTRRAIKRNKPLHLWGYRLTARFVDRIVCNSEAVRRFTAERERPDPAKLRVIPNGLDLSRYERGDREGMRARLGIASGAKVIGAVGTIKPVKGQAHLVEAMRPLLQARPELLLILAGENGSPYAQTLRREIDQAGLAERILLPGVTDQVPDLLAALDLFVLPSESEGMSNALIEAMAAGKGIVATDVGGNGECLAGGAAGTIVPAGDPAAMRNAIAAALDDAVATRRRAERAQARAKSEYDLETMLDRTERLYRELLDPPAAGIGTSSRGGA